MKGQYRVTAGFKIFIAQLLLSFIGVIIGFTWGLNAEQKTWSYLINKDINIFNSKEEVQTKEEAQTKEPAPKETFIVNTCISSFNTNLNSSSPERINNINLCVKAINGKIIKPGEVFSFNEVVGERTKERGYMEAPVIIGNDQIGLETGGGICQVSSTLYNSILLAGIKNIERTRHTLPPAYVKLGLDATVDWGNIDFKFTNTLEYPISLEGYIQNKDLYINIFSNPNLSKKKYVIENKIKEENGAYSVEVIRKTYENGVVTNSEIISNDIYTDNVNTKY